VVVVVVMILSANVTLKLSPANTNTRC